MNNEKNNLHNEETSIDINPDGPVAIIAEKNEKKQAPANSNAAAVGVVGAAGGAAVGSFASSLVTAYVDPLDLGPEEPVSDTADEMPVENYDATQIPFSNAVDDGMSFNQAFAAARQDVGSGGVFYWRGGWYGTYYADEWATLSDEFKADFSNHSYQLPEEYDGNQTGYSGASSAGETYTPAASSAEAGSDVYYDDPNDSSVEILGIEYAEVEGQTMAFAPVTIDGQDSVFVDVDVDGVFDIAIVDNGTDQPDYYDISDSNITHEDMGEMQKSQDDYLATNDLPDYANDANVDDFI